MTTKHDGLWAVAVVVVSSLLAPAMARAEGEEYFGDWSGTYYSNGAQITQSHLRFYKDSLGVLDGDWDGFPVLGWQIKENKLHLALSGTPKGGVPQEGIDHYLATCELTGNGLKIEYVGRSARGVVIRKGGTQPGGEFKR